MSLLQEAGLPQPPEGMFWQVGENEDGDIRLTLVKAVDESERRYLGNYKPVKSVWLVEAGQRFPQEITMGLLKTRAQEILKWWEIMEKNRMWLGVVGK